jgi:hypothetical protein
MSAPNVHLKVFMIQKNFKILGKSLVSIDALSQKTSQEWKVAEDRKEI